MSRHRFLITVMALLTAMALSASSVVAAPTAKADRAIKTANGCADKSAAVEAGGQKVKPAKNDQKANRGKHLGQKKHETTDSEEVELNGERPQNHGWFVSQVAKDQSVTGRDHGKAVSDVARSNQGKPDKPGD